MSEELAQSLPQECDFRHEARNSQRARRDLRCDQRDDVNIPRIYEKLTTKRVLTMERMDGCLVTDVARLREWGISTQAVSTLMAQVFSEQIFVHGFVHCDPHGGNVLVQPRGPKDRRPRLILLDHGLYRELDEPMRL